VVEIRRITVQGQAGQKVNKHFSQQIGLERWCAPVTPASQLHEKHKEEDHNMGWLEQNYETLPEKHLKQEKA
jgi:hypothetical protein